MKVDPSIFKAYDIRGVYPLQLNEKAAYLVGRSFAEFLKPKKVIVGRDMRLSGPVLKKNLIDGLTDQGVDVVDVGMVSTDAYYFVCSKLGIPGIMVTASHNPKEFNGFKMVRKMPYLLSGDEGIQDIRRLVEEGKFSKVTKKGKIIKRDYTGQFIKRVLSFVNIKEIRPLKVIADTANGMVGPFLTKLYSNLPVKLKLIYGKPDGNLPNHGLDPLMPENREKIEKLVVSEKADLGFMFDGDGDRFFVIDDRGKFVSGDFLTAILGKYLLEKHPGSKIIYDIRASWAVPDLIAESGGKSMFERVGHAFIKRRMADENGLFAGEITGHYYFRDFNYSDSGLIPSLLVLEMLSRKKVKMSDLLKPLEQKYFISGEINSKVADPVSKIKQLTKKYNDGQQNMLDGITVFYNDWHFNVRISNTESLLRLNVDAKSKTLMESKRDEILALIRS